MHQDGYEIQSDLGGWWTDCPICGDTSDTYDFRDQAQQWADSHTCPDADSDQVQEAR